MTWGIVIVRTMLSSRIFWIFLYAAVYVALLWAVFIYGVNVPFGDDLYLVPALEKLLLEHTATFDDLFVQLNEHIVLFPFLFTAGVISLVGWNMWYLLFLKVAMAGFVFLILSMIGHHSLPGSSTASRYFLGLLVAVFLFSWTQWEIWSHAITLNLYLTNAAFLAAVFVLTRWRNLPSLLIGGVLCFIATFSASHGMLSWIAMLPLLRRHHIVTWLFFTIPTVFFYAIHYTIPEWPPSPLYGLFHPHEFLLFIFTFLGAPLSPHFDILAAVLGGVMLGIACFILMRSPRLLSRPTLLPWFSIGLFSILTAVVITVGRVGFGVTKALQSRYIPLSTLALIALMYLLYAYAWRAGTVRLQRLLVVLGILLVALQLWLSALSIEQWGSRHASLQQGKRCLEVYTISAPTCLAKLGHNYISGDDVRALAPTLVRLRAFTFFISPTTARYSAQSRTKSP